MKTQIAILLLLLAPVALGQAHDHDEEEELHDSFFEQEVVTSGDLFLHGNQTLLPVPSAEVECLAIDFQTPTAEIKFIANLTGLDYHVESETIALTLPFTEGGNGGTGFRVDATIRQADGKPLLQQIEYAQGTSIPEAAVFAFEIPRIERNHEAFEVEIGLQTTGSIPAILTDVGILCNEESKVHSFDFRTFELIEDEMDDGHGHDDEEPIKPLYVILISIGAGIVTMAAAILPLLGRGLNPTRLHLFLGITAGLLLSIALVDLIPEAIEEGGGNIAWTVAIGVLVLYGAKQLFGETHTHGHDHDGEHQEEPQHNSRFAMVAFGALLFHRLVDGLALPGAFAAGGEVGFAASSAILLHQFPDGLAAATVFLAAGWKKTKVLLAVAGLAIATPIGSLLGLAFSNVDGSLPHLLALAAATFIFIALAELLPELQSKKFRYIVVIGFLVGYGLTFLIELVAQLYGGHSH
ncbi:MAG: ZIP family metal transporter [Thermoplasmatota archaeon]